MAAASHLSPQVVVVAERRGRKLDLWQTTAELLEELSKEVGQAEYLDVLP